MIGLVVRIAVALLLGLGILVGTIRSAIAGEWLDTAIAGGLALACFWIGFRLATGARRRRRTSRDTGGAG